MSTDRYVQIAEQHRTRRVRDLAFAVLLAAVVAFSITSIGAAARSARSAPSTASTCQLQPTC